MNIMHALNLPPDTLPLVLGATLLAFAGMIAVAYLAIMRFRRSRTPEPRPEELVRNRIFKWIDEANEQGLHRVANDLVATIIKPDREMLAVIHTVTAALQFWPTGDPIPAVGDIDNDPVLHVLIPEAVEYHWRMTGREFAAGVINLCVARNGGDPVSAQTALEAIADAMQPLGGPFQGMREAA